MGYFPVINNLSLLFMPNPINLFNSSRIATAFRQNCLLNICLTSSGYVVLTALINS